MAGRELSKRALLIEDLEDIDKHMERRRRNNAQLYKVYSALLLIGSGLAGIGGFSLGAASTAGGANDVFQFIPFEVASFVAGAAGASVVALRLIGKNSVGESWQPITAL